MSKLSAAHEGGNPNPRDSWPWWANELALWPTDDEPTGPSEADAEWAADNLNGDDGHTDDATPDEVYDQRAAESAEMDRMERGIRCY